VLRKPITKEDLLPPFQTVGEPGWADRLRHVLIDYEVPLPESVPAELVTLRESELGVRLPAALREFYTTFGSVDFDGFQLYPVDALEPLTRAWFRQSLDVGQQARLSTLIAISDSGSDNYIAIDPVSGTCYLCSHDPVGISDEAASFDDLVRKAVIDLSWGYYGWPDPEVERLATELKLDLFGR